jgi:serine/threonine-protein kinase
MRTGRILHYEILERLAAGAMGEVYLARDVRLGRSVVLKFLTLHGAEGEGRCERLEREARSLAALSHPNIVSVFALEADGDVVFLVMEHVDSETLAQVLGLGPVSPAEVAHIGASLAGALAHAHGRGVVHCDIKPDNILVTEEGQVRLADFGIASLRGVTVDDPATRVYGTPEYMSPEQAEGRPVDGRSDVYSLGVVLIEALTGEHPQPGVDPAAALARHGAREADGGRAAPADLRQVLARCVRCDPARRYADAAALHADLSRIARRFDDAADRRAWRRSAAFAAATTVVALAAVAAWLVLGRPGAVADAPGDAVRTVLVVPMQVRGGHTGDAYMGQALAEAVAIALARASRLRVLPVPEASDSVFEANHALERGAELLVTGNIVRRGGVNHANVSLVDARTRRILWGAARAVADRQLPFFASDVADEIARQLHAPPARLYDHYLYTLRSEALAGSALASDALGALRRQDYLGADSITRRLVERHPREPEGHVLRAFTLLAIGWSEERSPAQRVAFLSALRALREADPHTPWADAFEGLMLHREGRPADAVALYSGLLGREDLTAAARGLILSLRGQAYRDVNDPDAAVADLERAHRLDPTNDMTLVIYSDALGSAGRPAEGLLRARQALGLNPEASYANEGLARALGRVGAWSEALPYADHVAHKQPSRTTLALLATLLLHAGRREEAAAEARLAASYPESDWGAYELARYHALAGDRALALDLLREAFRRGYAEPGIQRHPEFDGLRGDPEFRELVVTMSRRWRPDLHLTAER